jgi:hypothetical protein
LLYLNNEIVALGFRFTLPICLLLELELIFAGVIIRLDTTEARGIFQYCRLLCLR